jgi:hypothetical protein
MDADLFGECVLAVLLAVVCVFVALRCGKGL